MPHPAPPADRLTPATAIVALGAALGGLLFGFDTAVVSGAADAIGRRFALGDAGLGFTVASALIGTVAGALAAGAPADRLGRRPLLRGIALAYLVSALGCALAGSWAALLAFRTLGGLAIGAASVVVPVFIAEVAPPRVRGRLVALNQLAIVSGILVAFASDLGLARAFPADVAWRWMLGVVAAPSALFLVVALLLPESPRWLLLNGRDAAPTLRRLGMAAPDLGAPAAARARLFAPAHARPIAAAVAIAMFNQLSGINALLYYAPRVFQLAGAGADGALLQSVAVGGTNLVFTLVAMALIDRVGRRPLMLAGSALCGAALVLVGVELDAARPDGTLVLAGLLSFIAAFAVSQGAVIWVFIAEVFPSPVRGQGQALGATTHWVMAAAITWAFPAVAHRLGGGVFFLFAGAMAAQLWWAWATMPETNGRPLDAG